MYIQKKLQNMAFGENSNVYNPIKCGILWCKYHRKNMLFNGNYMHTKYEKIGVWWM